MCSNRHPHENDMAGGIPRHDRTAWLKAGGRHCQKQPPTPQGEARRIIMLGAPGTDSEIQADILCERVGACRLSVGDILRTARCCPEDELTPAVQNALDHLNRGDSVPDETVLNLVGERLRCLNCSGGFILDGFPRTVAQAKALEQLLETDGIKLTAVFNYEMPVEKIVARISGRRTCANCRAVFHLVTRPPRTADTCDFCEGKLFQRDDDRLEAVTLRVEQYHAAVRPLLGFYQQRGLLVTIDADGAPEKVYQRTWLSTLVP